MKKTLILVASAVIVITACKKSDNKPTISIVGKWAHTKDIVQNYNAAGQFNNITDTADYSKSNDYYQFNSDRSGIIYQETTKGSGQYTSFPITYTLSGSTLTLTVNGSSQTEYIKVLTVSSLIIHADYVTKDGNGNLLYTDKADEYFSK
jgi:hypothetical protein